MAILGWGFVRVIPFLVIFWVNIYSSIERHFWFRIHDGSIYGFPTTKNYGHLPCISGNFHWWSVFIAHWSLCTSCPLFERCHQNPHVVKIQRSRARQLHCFRAGRAGAFLWCRTNPLPVSYTMSDPYHHQDLHAYVHCQHCPNADADDDAVDDDDSD